MPQRNEGKRVVRRTLADGSVREYRYDRSPKRTAKFCPESVFALISAYRGSPEWRGFKQRTQANRTYYLRDLDGIGNAPACNITRRDLLEIRNAIAGTRGHGAANGFIKMCSALFGWGVEQQWFDVSPTHKIKLLQGGHLTAWSTAEADRAMTELPPHLARVVLLARYTGQRRGDLVAMTWRSYDGTNIAVRQEKTGAALSIPAHPVLKAALDQWKMGASSTHILVSETGRPWKPNHLTHEMRQAMDQIEGLRANLNVHGLRKLAATELAEAGCSTHEIAAVTGHRSLAMVELYTRSAAQPKLAGAAIARLKPRQ